MTFDWKLAIVTLFAPAACADNGNDLGFWRDGKGGESGAETGGTGLGPSTGGSESAGENSGGTSGSSFSGGTSGADTSGGAGAASGTGGGAGSATSGSGGSAGGGGETSGMGGGGSGAGGSGGNPPACEGFPPPGQTACSTDSECSAGLFCRFVDDPQGCGIPCMASRECESSDECGNDGLCLEFQESCCPSNMLSTRCTPRCTAASCLAGEQCGTSGQCECTAGGCGPNHECEPQSEGPARCVRRQCSDVSDCDCGLCNEGSCTPEVGFCDSAQSA